MGKSIGFGPGSGCLPRFPSSSNAMDEFDKYEKKEGFSHLILFDLQRVHACLLLAAEQHGNHRGYICEVGKAQSAFSNKVSNAMSALPAWRWGVGDRVYLVLIETCSTSS